MKKHLCFLAALFISLCGLSQSYQHKQKVIASDGQSEDFFGESSDISFDGKYLIVGAMYNDTSTAPNRGAAYIYNYDPALDGWRQQAKLTVANLPRASWFGKSVCIDGTGTYAVAGAYNMKDNNLNAVGAVYVFKRSGNNWIQQAKLMDTASQAGELFGTDVDISYDGKTVVVSAVAKDAGMGRVFIYNRTGTKWNLTNSFAANDGNSFDWFGNAISLSANGKVLAAGAYQKETIGNPPIPTGAVYIFNKGTGNTWTQTAKLYPADALYNMEFGYDVELSDDGKTLIAGLIYGGSDTSFLPGAYVFKNGTAGWAQQAKLIPAGTLRTCEIAMSVAISATGDTVVVGEPSETLNNVHQTGAKGTAFVFTRNGNVWSEKEKIFNPAGENNDNLSECLSITPDGKKIFAGAVQNGLFGFGRPGYLSYFHLDSSASYKNVVANNNFIKVYPNPSSGFIMMTCDKKEIKGSVRIEDRSGNVVLNIKHVQANQPVDISMLKADIYYVRLIDESGKIYSASFIKE